MSDKYILDGHTPIPMDDLLAWGRWLQTADRTVAKTSLNDQRVSTVFLGLDHSWSGCPPLLFETMIFGEPNDGWQERCSTWEEAEAMHARAVEIARNAVPTPEPQSEKP